MKIGVVVIGYSRPDSLKKLLESTYSDDVFYSLFTHSKNKNVADVMGAFENAHFDHVDYRPYGVNRGLALSWNEGIHVQYEDGADVVIVINDDVAISGEDLHKLAQYAIDHREAGIVTPWGFNKRMNEQQYIQYSCFAINPLALERVGYFDINFFPIYYEDCDYSRRAFLLNVPIIGLDGTALNHESSATIYNDDNLFQQNNITFKANQSYYLMKWQGDPTREGFKYPFNNREIPLKIEWDRAFSPYDDWDIVRNDRGNVRI